MTRSNIHNYAHKCTHIHTHSPTDSCEHTHTHTSLHTHTHHAHILASLSEAWDEVSAKGGTTSLEVSLEKIGLQVFFES